MTIQTETPTAYYADSRVAYRSDGGYTVHAHNDVFQILYLGFVPDPRSTWALLDLTGLVVDDAGAVWSWCICRGDQYDVDPFDGQISPGPTQPNAAVGYTDPDTAINILIGAPQS